MQRSLHAYAPRMHMGGSGTEKSEERTRGAVTPQSALLSIRAKDIKEKAEKSLIWVSLYLSSTCLLLESLCAVMSYRDPGPFRIVKESCFRFRFPQLDPTILWATKDPRRRHCLAGCPHGFED
jgi:hypothetical protein